jgi:2-iminobutanoate/2-iminopropanoate deaminase
MSALYGLLDLNCQLTLPHYTALLNMETNNTIYDIGIASQVGTYSDAIGVDAGRQWLFTSGTLGLSPLGYLPADIEEQSALAWQNIISILNKAGMAVDDIVKVTQYLTRPEDIPEYAKVRKSYLGDARPASTLLITPQFGWPGMLVEVEVIAAKKD